MDTGLLCRLTPALVLGAFLAWMAALFIGLSANSVTATVVLRTLLTLCMLPLVVRAMVRRAHDGPALSRTVAVAAVLGYALSPAAWAGRALIGQIVLDPGPGTFAIDLVVWVAVVVIAGRLVTPRPAASGYQPYQLT